MHATFSNGMQRCRKVVFRCRLFFPVCAGPFTHHMKGIFPPDVQGHRSFLSHASRLCGGKPSPGLKNNPPSDSAHLNHPLPELGRRIVPSCSREMSS